MHWFDNSSPTLQSGNIFPVVRWASRAKEGNAGSLSERQGIFQKVRTEETPMQRGRSFDIPSNAILLTLRWSGWRDDRFAESDPRAVFSYRHPVIGDRKYHLEEASERLIARVALHAAHFSSCIRDRTERLD